VSPASPLHLAVASALDAGMAVLPPMQDGSKAPIAAWKRYQTEAPTREQVRTWYGRVGYLGLGVVTGMASGGLEMLELEGRAIADGLLAELLTLAEASGLGELVARIEAGYTESTPSGGLHWLYRTDRPLGNTKLASRPATAAELAERPGDKVKVLVETRGQGGYVITAPSNGKVHPTGGRWTLTAGGFGSIAMITETERDALFSLCRTFDRMPQVERRSVGPSGSDRPGDRYNERSDVQATTLDLLLRHGWSRVYTHAGADYLRRPGKDAPGISATLGYVAPGVLHVFSTSSVFTAGAHDPFGVYAVLEHGGDFTAAAKALEPRTSKAERSADQPGMPDLRDVFDSLQDTTEYPFLVDRMFRLGYFALLAAYESTGKSYIGTQIALSVIVTRPVFGEFAVNEPMGVCVFDMEMGESEDRNRDRQMMADMGIGPEQVRGLYRRITLDDASLSLKDPDHVAYIGAQLDKAHAEMGRPILAILDSTDSMVSKRPWGDDAETLDRAISQLRDGRRGWLVVLLLCHTKKRPSEGKADYVRDLEDVLGNLTRQADMAMVLDLKGGFALRCGIYKRPGRSAGILQRGEDGFAWTWTADIGEAGTTKVDTAAVAAELRAACDESENGRTTAYVMANRLNVGLNTAKRYLSSLEAASKAQSTDEGTWRGRVEYWPGEAVK
jgi:hypothetical protein